MNYGGTKHSLEVEQHTSQISYREFVAHKTQSIILTLSKYMDVAKQNFLLLFQQPD